eukprot:1065333-Prorocentrum_minimum.AAC.5
MKQPLRNSNCDRGFCSSGGPGRPEVSDESVSRATLRYALRGPRYEVRGGIGIQPRQSLKVNSLNLKLLYLAVV